LNREMKNLNLSKLVSVARGDAPADLILKNAKIVNTFVGIIEEGNIAIVGDRIAGIGSYAKAKRVIDLKGTYVAPGLMNGHIHIESSMLHPASYAHAAVTKGTTAIITDLHEIANVAGLKGMQFAAKWAQKLPLDMFIMVPSCVPATNMETSGATITAADLRKALKLPNVLGLGEVMSFHDVIAGNRQVISKITATKGRVIDGHAPGLADKQLNAYLATGIRSDHESTSIEEGREKLRRGMYLMIREGSSAKNLAELLPLVTDKTYKRCLFVTDDRTCTDLLFEGDVDAVVRKAIQLGLEPVRAVQLATINTAEYFRLYDRGGIAPGYIANLITMTNLSQLQIDMVFYKGQLIAREGEFLLPPGEVVEEDLMDTVHIKPFDIEALKLTTNEESLPVIEIVPGQIITKKRFERVKKQNDCVVPDLEKDILKLVVVERHRASGNIGRGLVKGFGLKQGALASSIAHDSHNIIAVGTNDYDIFVAVKEIERLRGGLAVSAHGKVLAILPLPIAGLLSPEPLAKVVDQFSNLEKVAASLGNLPPSPFAVLSFLALPVIPELRLTDKGLVDVQEYRLIR